MQLFRVADSAKFQALCSLSESILRGRALSRLLKNKKKTEKRSKTVDHC